MQHLDTAQYKARLQFANPQKGPENSKLPKPTESKDPTEAPILAILSIPVLYKQ